MTLTADTHEPTVAVHFARLVTDYCEQHHLNQPQLLAAAGLTAPCLQELDSRLLFTQFVQLCDTASEQLQDPLLGLHLGQHIKPGYFGSHGFALISCQTVDELLQQSMRYSSLVMDACRNEIEVQEENTIRLWRSNLANNAPIGRLQDELNMAAWLTLARWTTGINNANPAWVAFRHAEPSLKLLGEYQALFRCPIHFNAPETAIAFASHYLHMPLPQANAGVQRMMYDLCAKQLAQLHDHQDAPWLAACKQAIIQSIPHAVPELETIALSLHLTARELQRRLAEKNLVFRHLVDELRFQLAENYMQDLRLNVVDIAYLLGFSEQSAFQRAFKRWTGITPKEYRQQANNRGRP